MTRWERWMHRMIPACRWCAQRPWTCQCGKGGGRGGGTTTTTTIVQPAPKSEEELALMREQLKASQKQNELFAIQVEEVKRQNDEFARTVPAQRALFEAQTTALTRLAELQTRQITHQETILAAEGRHQVQLAEAIEAAGRDQAKLTEAIRAATTESPVQKRLREAAEERALAFVEGRPPPVTPGQASRLAELFGARRAEGEEEITRFAEELAGIRNLPLASTPIGGEAIRAKERLERALQGARAGAELDITQAERLFAEQMRQFQEGLRQQAFLNRIALAGGGSGQVLPIFGQRGALPLVATGGLTPPMFPNLFGDRGSTTTSQTTTSARAPFNWLGLAQPVATLGAASFPFLFGGGGAAAAAAPIAVPSTFAIGMSSARLKRAIEPLDQDEYDRALARLRATPITRWRYRWEDDRTRVPHIGPIAELSPEEIREGPLAINVADYAGLLHAGLKAVDRRVRRLEGEWRDVQGHPLPIAVEASR